MGGRCHVERGRPGYFFEFAWLRTCGVISWEAMGNYIGAIDQGTTSTRFIVFDQAGRIVSVAQKEHEQIFPQPGWVEHDANEIWRRTREVIAGALEQRGLTAADLAAIGITNQRETTVVWDRQTGAPVYNALVWQDTRTADAVAELARSGGSDRFRAKTGLPLATYFSALKLRWILDNVAGARARAEAGELLFGNIDTFLLWNLTGGLHLTDVTNASRTQLMNLETLDWDDELAGGVPHSARRCCRASWPSSEVYGEATLDGVKGVPVAGILGDQQAALVGQTCFHAGRGQEHLRHGMLPADEYRDEAGAFAVRHADHGGVQDRRAAGGVRARRQRGDHGRAGAVGARQFRTDRKEQRYRGAGAHA